MSHPAMTGRWRWRPSRPARSAVGDPAVGDPAAGDPAAGGSAVGGPAAVHAGVAALDARRRLQLLLAGLWLLDGVLQLQPAMFTRQFPAMLAESAAGQPGAVAGPVTWAARLITEHPAPANAAFAALQIALGLGLAWRPAVRPALAGSVVWGLAVWGLGEGLGGLLTGTASPVEGAPGAALLYAVTAVLLWPPRPEGSSTSAGAQATPGRPAPGAGKRPEPAGRSVAQDRPGPAGQDGAVSLRAGSRLTGMAGGRGMAGGSGAGDAAQLGVAGDGRRSAGWRGQPVPFVAGQAVGVRAAAVVWLVLWGGLAVLAMQPAVRAPHAFGGLLAGLAGDAPGWLARADGQASAALGGHGLVASVLLAVLMAAIGVAGCRPDRAPAAARTAVIAAATFGAVTAAAGGFGELFTGMATDPGTGPILALVALAYWPSRLALPASVKWTDPDPAGPADPSEALARPASVARPASSATPASLAIGTTLGPPGPRAGGTGAGPWG